MTEIVEINEINEITEMNEISEMNEKQWEELFINALCNKIQLSECSTNKITQIMIMMLIQKMAFNKMDDGENLTDHVECYGDTPFVNDENTFILVANAAKYAHICLSKCKKELIEKRKIDETTLIPKFKACLKIYQTAHNIV
jgi:hypothetical protein